MKRSIYTVAAVCALTLFFVGCGPRNAHFQDVRQAVFDGQEKLNKNIEVSLGFIPLRLAETVAVFIDEPEVQEARQYLDHVSRVDVGVYEVHESLKTKRSAAAQRVKATMQEHGFEPVVMVREERETVGVYVPTEEGEFPKEFFVVVMSEHEVVLVRMRGELEDIILAAVKDHAHELPNLDKVFKEEIVL